jgi:hypothetical protein
MMTHEDFKIACSKLTIALKKEGVKIPHTKLLELVSQSLGYKNYNTFRGCIKSEQNNQKILEWAPPGRSHKKYILSQDKIQFLENYIQDMEKEYIKGEIFNVKISPKRMEYITLPNEKGVDKEGTPNILTDIDNFALEKMEKYACNFYNNMSTSNEKFDLNKKYDFSYHLEKLGITINVVFTPYTSLSIILNNLDCNKT